jgi:ribosome-binding factor A
MSTLRHQRVRELLKRTVGEILRREISIEAAGLITVNDVGVSADLHSATVFVGVIGSPEQQQRARQVLEKNRPRIQFLLGQAVVLKYTPHLRFVVDDSIQRGNRIIEIIEDLEKDLPPHDDPSENH